MLTAIEAFTQAEKAEEQRKKVLVQAENARTMSIKNDNQGFRIAKSLQMIRGTHGEINREKHARDVGIAYKVIKRKIAESLQSQLGRVKNHSNNIFRE